MKTVIALLASAFVVAGCNTIKGAGQDIQRAGQKIEEATKK